MRELSAQYPRYGYRRIQVFLARRGFTMSADRAYRIWKKARLQVPRRRPRRRVATGRPRPLPATRANQVWAYDFVFDACANGQQLKCLTVIDEFTRECLAIDVAGSIRSPRVIETLAKLISTRGVPKHLRSDNGPEFVSRAVLRWLHEAGVETAPIDPGKALAERIERELQRKVSGRVSRNAVVQESNRCEGRDRGLAKDAQRSEAALEPQQSHAFRVRSENLSKEPGTGRLLGIFGPKKSGSSAPASRRSSTR
jgi:putative transposase